MLERTHLDCYLILWGSDIHAHSDEWVWVATWSDKPPCCCCCWCSYGGGGEMLLSSSSYVHGCAVNLAAAAAHCSAACTTIRRPIANFHANIQNILHHRPGRRSTDRRQCYPSQWCLHVLRPTSDSRYCHHASLLVRSFVGSYVSRQSIRSSWVLAKYMSDFHEIWHR